MPLKRSRPQTPLQTKLITLVRAAMLERGVGYVKLANLSGFHKDSLSRGLGPRKAKQFSCDSLLVILYALGYTCDLSIFERGLSDNEREYMAAKGRPKKQSYTYARTFPNYATDTAESIRFVVGRGGLGEREGENAGVVEGDAKMARQDHSTLEKATN